jgi:two-component system, sensor histidine kinase and response regulator
MSELTETLLIVDDERLNLNTLVELFQPKYRVIIAKNGQQALERAWSKPSCDLILLDIMMPAMDGFEVCRRLKDDERSRDIPIIFITALDAEEDQIRGFDLGAVDFITKPFMPNVVKARVKTHLSLRAAQKQLKQQNITLLEGAELREDIDRIMRHDLKGPLSLIIGFPQLLLEDENIDSQLKNPRLICSDIFL